jgi:uncharacterized membrane protein
MKIWRKTFLFCLGGGLYAALELLWRGRTHGSMFLLGGGCFWMLGQLRRLRISWPLLTVLGTAAVTAGELVTGLIVNRDYAVWDYRAQPLQFRGQICLGYSLLWMPLSLFAMWLYGWTERKMP